LMAFIIYYVAKKHAASFSPRTVYLAIIVGFAGAIAQWWRGDLFELLAPRIIRTVKAIEGSRGVSGLSAEPSFLAGMAVVQALILYYYYRIGRTSGRVLAIGCALAFIMVAMSKSATGFVYLLLVCAIWMAYFAVRGLRLSVWVGAVALIVGLLLLIAGPLATSRGGVVLARLYDSPATFVADGSLQERAVSFFFGVVSLPYHPFGAGGGAYYHVSMDMARIYDAQRIFSNARPDVFGGVLSSMGLYLAELGIVFIFFLAIIFWRSLRLDALHLALCALAMAFIAATFSITCPLTWLPLGLAARPEGLRMRPATARA
jgi:hypothetical protein